MKLTGETKLFLGILVGSIVLIAIAAVFLTKQAPTISRSDLVPAGAHSKGNPDAKTYLVEFSDYQCPACLAAKPTVDDIVNQYKDQLLFVYRNFPLDQHPFGQKAAQTAEAAGAQGKYWEMYDLLFANQEKFSDELFGQLAQSLQLDPEKFSKDFIDSRIKNIILDDISAGSRFGVNATPTFFLNGKKLELSSFADLKTAVEQEIATNKQ